MLIDDIPYLKIAQKEHDYFAKTLQKQGIHVVYLDPMPNVYFTRDQQAAIGNGMTINRMTFRARRRESLFMKTILKHHPDLEDQDIPVWRDRYHHGRIEGGDELVLNKHVLAIEISQRISAAAITDLVHALFGHSSFDTILAIRIPHNHAMMHLDTVFTMINYDQFTVHPSFFLNQVKSISMYFSQIKMEM